MTDPIVTVAIAAGLSTLGALLRDQYLRRRAKNERFCPVCMSHTDHNGFGLYYEGGETDE